MKRKRRNTNGDRITIGGVVHMTLGAYANAHGVDVKQMRRNARNGNIPNAIQPIGNTWVVPVDMDIPIFASRGPRSKHDGKRMIVYVPDAIRAEHDAWCMANGIDVVDPAVLRAARKRRIADADTAS